MMTFFVAVAGAFAFIMAVGAVAIYETIRKPIAGVFKKNDRALYNDVKEFMDRAEADHGEYL